MKRLAFLLALLLVPPSLHAQGTAAAIQNGTQPGSPSSPVDVTPSSQFKEIPELYPGETNDFGTQQIVKEKTHRKWVELNLDWQYGYNDNYLLTNLPVTTVSGGKPQSTQMLSTWDFAFAPDAIKYDDIKLFPRIGFRQSFWNYGIGTGQNSNFASYDFDTQTVYGAVRADLNDGWSVNLGGDWTRITSSNSDSEIYRQMGPHAGVSKIFQINDYNLVSLSFDQQYLFTEVPRQSNMGILDGAGHPFYYVRDNPYDRANSTVSLSYIWSPIDRLYVVPFYRMVYSFYSHYATLNTTSIFAEDDQDRSDFTNTVGVTTSYQFNDYVTARVYVSYEKRYTTYSNPDGDPNNTYVPEYGNLQAGMGAGVTIRF